MQALPLDHLRMGSGCAPDPTHLERRLGLRSLILLICANMIGTGIFTTSGLIAQQLTSPESLLLTWLMGGLLAFCGALCYAELGGRLPAAGGEYVFLRETFGQTAAFLSGWVSLLVGFSAPIAAGADAFATYLLLLGPDDLELPGGKNAIGVLLILLFTLVHQRGVVFGVRLQNWLSTSKLLLILGLIVGGLTLGQGKWEHFSPKVNVQLGLSEGFATSLIIVSYAYSGWNAAAYLGGEAKNPRRNIPASIIFATLLVGAIYLLINVVYVYALGSHGMSGSLEIGGKAAMALFGDNCGLAFTGCIAFFILSSISAMMLLSS